MSTDYRTRIYGNYVAARAQALAPTSLAGLQPRAASLRQLIRRHFPRDKNAAILDLGCGHGALIYFAGQEGYTNLRGVDGSPQQVAAARQLGIAHVEQGDLRTALREQPDQSLDVVVMFDVIEHFTKTELLAIVDDVARVLRPSGRWIIHVPNGMSPFCGASLYNDFTHELAFTCNSLDQLLLSSGFSSVDYFEDKPAIHGIKSAVRGVLWTLIHWAWSFYFAIETGALHDRRIFSQNMLAIAYR